MTTIKSGEEIRHQDKVFDPYEEAGPQKLAYEWVMTMSKGEDVILSENQYAVYKAQVQSEDNRKLLFSDTEINPVFVVSGVRRPADYIRRKYPCRVCHSAGRNDTNTGWCLNCGGSGVDLPKK